MEMEPKFLTSGDSCLIVEYGKQIDPQINKRVRSLAYALEQENRAFIQAIVPTYRSLMIQYDLLLCPYEELVLLLEELDEHLEQISLPSPNLLEVPTWYGGEAGEDLKDVASFHHLTEDEVIAIHSGVDYQIYMLGFTPAYPYLGGLDERIFTPRLSTPRTKVPGGTVCIGGCQTGIYSVDSPGGHRLIGRTPIALYDQKRNPPILYKAGDYLRFIPITEQEYRGIEEEVRQGVYEYRYYPIGGGNDR